MTQIPPITWLQVPNKVYEAVFDKDAEHDVSLPEYCPEVTRLIRVDCTPYADTCEIENGKLMINGHIVYEVLYETDRKNKLRFHSFTEEFSHQADLPQTSLDSLHGESEATCNKITCKMLSPRRLVLHARLELHTVVHGIRRVQAISTAPCEGVFFKKKTFRIAKAEQRLKETFRFDETVPLLQGEKNIKELVFGTVTVQPPQVTSSAGCIRVKSNATVKALYEPESSDDGYRMSVKNIPVSLTLEHPGIEEDALCSVGLTVPECSVVPELDQYGENRLLKVTFTVRATASLVGFEDVTVAEDLISVGMDSTLGTDSLTLSLPSDTTERSFTVDLKFPSGETQISSVYDATVRPDRVRAEIADGGVRLNGTLTVSVLGDGTDGALSRDYVEEFDQFVPAEMPANVRDLHAEVLPFEVLPTLHSDGSISMRVICTALLSGSTEETVSFLSEVVKQTERDAAERDFTVAYFFPNGSDDVWSIAKRYSVDPDRLRRSNPGAFDEGGKLQNGTKTVTVSA